MTGKGIDPERGQPERADLRALAELLEQRLREDEGADPIRVVAELLAGRLLENHSPQEILEMLSAAREQDLEDRTPLRGVPGDDGRPIDLDFRPATYWPDQEDEGLRAGRIRGEQRRLRAEAALREGRFDPEDPLFAHDLPEEELEGWGRLHPMNLGGEYLPELAPGEAEIARVALASTTGDVQSIRARRSEEGIVVVVVDEYGNQFETGERIYDRPLTLRELIEFIDESDIEGADWPAGGLVLGTIRAWFEYCREDPDQLLDAVWASSSFYPDLGLYYARAIRRELEELTGSA